MSAPTIAYTAHPTLRRFHQSGAGTRVIIGPIRSGRTTAALVELISRSNEQSPDDDQVRRTRWAVAGASTAYLRNSVIPIWQELAPESSFGGLDNLTHTISRKLPDGSAAITEVIFLAAGNEGEAGRLASLKLTGAVLSGEGIHHSAIDFLRSSIGLYPAQPTWHGVVVESIWPEHGYWLHTMAAHPMPGTDVFIQPGGDTAEAENLAALPEGYYQRLIDVNTPEWSARHIRVRSPSMLNRQPTDLELLNRLHRLASTQDRDYFDWFVDKLGADANTITTEYLVKLKADLAAHDTARAETIKAARRRTNPTALETVLAGVKDLSTQQRAALLLQLEGGTTA